MLSSSAVRLLIDIAIQYNGANNGDLQASTESNASEGMGQFINAESGETRASPLWFCRTDKAGWPRLLFATCTQSPGKVSMAVMERYKCRVLKLLRVCLSKPNRNSGSKYCNQKGRLTILALFC